MIDTTTIKKYYLRYWVDQSQAARKAAEELAMKEVRPSLRDLHKNDINQDLVFTLDGYRVEFKGENEENPKDPEYNFFTYEEAIERFGEPDEDGWRLPTKEEFKALIGSGPYDFKDGQGVFDNRLCLPAMGYRTQNNYSRKQGEWGCYLTTTPYGINSIWELYFDSKGAILTFYDKKEANSIRLVREVK